MRTIELIISPEGQTRLETRGFEGASCRDASLFIEKALGGRLSERPTAEMHQAATEQKLQQGAG